MYKLTDKKYVNLTVLLCTAVYFVSYITRINYSAVLVEIIADLGITKPAASLAVTGSAVTYGIGQLISGYLGDRIKPQLLITGGLITTALMNLVLPFSDYRLMIAAWCINGLAQAMMWPPIVKIMSTLLSVEDYKKGSVKVSWGSSFGTIAVYLLSPLIIESSGWHTVFYISAAAAIIMAAVLPAAYGKITSHAVFTATEASEIPMKGSMSSKTPVMLMFLLIAPGIILQGILRDGITTWMPSYISDTYNLGSSISILTGVILPVFGILSYQIASYLNRKVIKNELTCAAAIFSAGLVSSVLLMLANNANAVLSVILAAVITGSMHGVNVMLICMTPPYFSKYGKVSLISGMLNSCTYIGSAISGYGTALISDNFGWSATIAAWAAVAAAGTLCCLLPAGLWNRFKEQ